MFIEKSMKIMDILFKRKINFMCLQEIKCPNEKEWKNDIVEVKK